jgi:GNAT superfamily N-acetyltransferase
VDGLLQLIRELARYEREPDAATATRDDLAQALFGPDPRVHALVVDDGTGQLAAMAVWFLSFSTWEGRHGIWLEDLFVLSEHRGRGMAGALLAELAAICVERGYRRLEWNVLDWNTPALDVYRRLGAGPLTDWTVHRLDGQNLQDLARRRRVGDRSAGR